jgi:hypothetical protein
VGLHRLPPVADVAATPLVLGPWCWVAPLWGNPFFISPLHPDGIDHPFFDFAAAGISTLGQLLHLQQALAAVASQAAYTLVRFAQLSGSYAFAERHVAVERTGALLAALPAGWVVAARAAALALAARQKYCVAQAREGSHKPSASGAGPAGGRRLLTMPTRLGGCGASALLLHLASP